MLHTSSWTHPGAQAHQFIELRPAAATRRVSEGQKSWSLDGRRSNPGLKIGGACGGPMHKRPCGFRGPLRSLLVGSA
eukprot:7848914-Pyramimonas_sp.AAC.1